MARLARVLKRQELRVEAGQLPHARTRNGSQVSIVRRVSPSAGTRPDAAQLVDLDELLAAYRREPAGPGVVRDLRAPRHLTQGHVHRSPCPGHQRGDRAPPESRGDQPGRCSSRATRTRCPSPRSTPRSAVFSAHGIDVRVDADGGYTPTPALSHAILTHPGTRRDRADAVAQPARGRRLQVQPAERRAGRHRHHQAHRGRGQRAAATARSRPPTRGRRRTTT